MIRKDKINRGGRLKTQIRVVESYRPSGEKSPKQRTVKSFGYLEDQPDPVKFMAEVELFNKTKD